MGPLDPLHQLVLSCRRDRVIRAGLLRLAGPQRRFPRWGLADQKDLFLRVDLQALSIPTGRRGLLLPVNLMDPSRR